MNDLKMSSRARFARFDGVLYRFDTVPDYGFGSIVRVYDADGHCVRVFDTVREAIEEMRMGR